MALLCELLEEAGALVELGPTTLSVADIVLSKLDGEQPRARDARLQRDASPRTYSGRVFFEPASDGRMLRVFDLRLVEELVGAPNDPHGSDPAPVPP